MARDLYNLLPMTDWWNEDGSLPDSQQEELLADIHARALWGLTDPDDVCDAVAGYRQRMAAARIKYADVRDDLIARAQATGDARER